MSELERRTKSVIKLAAIAAKAGVSTVPGATSAVELAEHLVNEAFAYHQRRASDRLREFHIHLVSPGTDEEREQLLNRDLDLDDYYVVLQDVLADEENDKVLLYALLLRALIEKDYPSKVRAHLLKSFRALSMSDFQVLEAICKATHSEGREPDASAPSHLIRRLLPENDPFPMASVKNLVTWGYILEGHKTVPWPGPLARYVAEVLGYPPPRQ